MTTTHDGKTSAVKTYSYDANGRLLSQRVNDLFGNPDYLVDYGFSAMRDNDI